MDLYQTFALVLDPGHILRRQHLPPDPWQRDLLLNPEPFLLLNCSRQAGKSTTVAALALHQLLVWPGSLVLLVAPSERQSQELYRKVLAGFRALENPVPTKRCNQDELELTTGSRIVALPGSERTVRSFSGVNLLIIDEAARVPDELYRAVRPMLAVSRGRLVALSTPFGQRGWFFDEWSGHGPWQRVQIPWSQCPRIAADFIAEEERALGKAWVDQEYGCSFVALEGLVYPDFYLACVPEQAVPEGKDVGGIDFGWRNPFAAVWGVLDRDDILWLIGERYRNQTPLSDHALALPKKVVWYADPSGATEIAELRRRNLVVRRGPNRLEPGLAAVTERIRTGRLMVLPACRNLIAEAGRYRYPTPSERATLGEEPIDADNHALAALRYLVLGIARIRGQKSAVKDQPIVNDDDGWQTL